MARSQPKSGGKANNGTSQRGFAAMDKEKQRQIASMGGKASHHGGRSSGSSRGNR